MQKSHQIMCLIDNEKVSRKKVTSGKNLSGALILFWGGVFFNRKKNSIKKITYYLKLFNYLNYLFIYLFDIFKIILYI